MTFDAKTETFDSLTCNMIAKLNESNVYYRSTGYGTLWQIVSDTVEIFWQKRLYFKGWFQYSQYS